MIYFIIGLWLFLVAYVLYCNQNITEYYDVKLPPIRDLNIPTATELEFQQHIKVQESAIDNWYKTIEADNVKTQAQQTGRVFQGTTEAPTQGVKKKRSRNKATSKRTRIHTKQKSKKRKN